MLIFVLLSIPVEFYYKYLVQQPCVMRIIILMHKKVHLEKQNDWSWFCQTFSSLDDLRIKPHKKTVCQHYFIVVRHNYQSRGMSSERMSCCELSTGRTLITPYLKGREKHKNWVIVSTKISELTETSKNIMFHSKFMPSRLSAVHCGH